LLFALFALLLAAEILLASVPELGYPRLGVVANARFSFNARAQWDLFDDDGKISDPLKLSEAVVLSVTVRQLRHRVVTAGNGVLVFDGFRAGLSKAADRPLFLL